MRTGANVAELVFGSSSSSFSRRLNTLAASPADLRTRARACVCGCVSTVFSVNKSTLAFDAFEKMNSENISGLAVTDEDGKLVDVASLSDLKRLGRSGKPRRSFHGCQR